MVDIVYYVAIEDRCQLVVKIIRASNLDALEKF